MDPHHETQDLQRRLEDAEETLRAIRSGEVDALVVEGSEGERVFTLQGPDLPYRALVEAMQQGAVCLTSEGLIIYCNRCFANMLKRPHEKVIGAALTAFLPASQHRAFEVMLRQGNTQSSEGEVEFQTAAGDLVPVCLALSPLTLLNAVAVCLVATDLTERKKHNDIRDANRRKDEFLAMLAHELRNPLAPIRNAVGILQHLGPIDENLTYATEIIERQIHVLSRLVDDLLDVSRLTLNKVNLQKETVELSSLISRAIETSQPIIDARKHRLTLSLPPKDLRVEVDPTRLAQVISNLVTNAAKYTDEGGEIFLTAQREGRQVVIRVRDTGIGISADLLPHIFDLFIQGDRALARSEGGLGIGLTLVHRLVEMHGGTVEAHSEGSGKGSEFVVRLPAPEKAPSAGAEVGRESLPAGGTPFRILVVDDNKDGANSLAILLRIMGHQVRIVYSGFDAIEAAQVFHPHAMLLDIGLPGMNGYEVAKQLKEEKGFESMLLIAMTGYGQEEDKQRSRQAGFHHHFVKPIDLPRLEGVLASVNSARFQPVA